MDKVIAVNNEHDDNFEFNQELIGLEQYELLKELVSKSFEPKWFKRYSNGDHGHKAKKRKKKLAYFERKNDRKMNKRMKREFYKKHALSLQY